VTDSNKHSSLLSIRINYDRSKFYSTGYSILKHLMAGKARVFYFVTILKVLGAQLGVRLAGTNTPAYNQTVLR